MSIYPKIKMQNKNKKSREERHSGFCESITYKSLKI